MTDDAQIVPASDEERDGYIKCPHCRTGMLKDVKDSRPTTVHGIQSIRRRRVCQSCGERSSTYEIPENEISTLFVYQSAKMKFAAHMVDLIEAEVRSEMVRRIEGSRGDDSRAITPWDEDIQ